MDTIHAMAMILGRKICFAPPESITGFFSTSRIEDSFECLSSFILAIFVEGGTSGLKMELRGDSRDHIKHPRTPHRSSVPQCRHLFRQGFPLVQQPRDHTVVLPIARARWAVAIDVISPGSTLLSALQDRLSRAIKRLVHAKTHPSVQILLVRAFLGHGDDPLEALFGCGDRRHQTEFVTSNFFVELLE